MTLELWHIIVTATLDVRLLLDNTLQAAPDQEGDEKAAVISPADQKRLREQLLGKLTDLRGSLRTLLSEKEAGMVLLPLVIHIDELVMSRLNRSGKSKWLLLQKELFDLSHGGEVFFDFANERLNKPDTPPILFAVLYFCLSDGFVGKFATEPAKIDQFKRLLVERIPLPPAAPKPEKRKRAKEAELPAVRPVNPQWFYVVAIACVLGAVGLTALFTNL